MARGRKTKVQIKSSTRVKETPKRRYKIDWTQSYTSLLLGIVVVVVGILFVASVVREHNNQQTQQTSSISTENTDKTTPSPSPSPLVYTVNKGDSLWDIAEKTYQDGSRWTEIAKLNHLTSPYTIEAGQVLQLPEITPVPAQNFGQTLSPSPEKNTDTKTLQSSGAIDSNTYTVQRGDNLWDIAVRAYADGYRWLDIAKANNLSNPDLIHAGNVFIIPRPGQEFRTTPGMKR